MVVFHRHNIPIPIIPFPPMALFPIPILLTILGVLCITLSVLVKKAGGASSRKPPPGPRGLPIIGCLHLLGNLPHRNLTVLAKKYGPIMFMRLGSVPTVVVSSPQAAKLFLRTHDTVFAGRPKIQAFKYLTYDTKGIAFREYGPYWRDVRKFCTVELLSSAKINSFASVRKEEVGMFVQSLKEMAAARQTVDITAKVTEVVENITYRMLFGRSKAGWIDLINILQEATRLAGSFNLADYFPFLGPLDLQVCIMEIIHKIMDIYIYIYIYI